MANEQKKFKLVLVRHGQTTYNKTKMIQGQLDTKLSELGIEQAKMLGEYVEKTGEKFDRVYSSDLSRAYDTCVMMCKGKYEIKRSQLLRERHFGVLQDTPLDNLRAGAKKAGFDDSNFTQFRPEGGETMEEVQARLKQFCREELFPNARDGDKILLVSHGGVKREFFKYFKQSKHCELTNEDMRISPNTGISRFEILLPAGGSGEPMIFVESLHQIPHLEGSIKDEALNEVQLNDSSMAKKQAPAEEKKEEEYAI